MAETLDNTRFNTLLTAMINGDPPSSAQKKPSGDQASGVERDACYSDTQIPPDILEDASR